jgi:hypothetical protein
MESEIPGLSKEGRVKRSETPMMNAEYFWVTSMGSTGESGGVQSKVSQFTTP